MMKARSMLLTQFSASHLRRTRGPYTASTIQGQRSYSWTSSPMASATNNSEKVMVSQTKAPSDASSAKKKDEKVVVEACGDVDDVHDDDDDGMEQEEMFVEAHESFEHQMPEWGGPRRGGRLPEPTRFGDWERKGRCTDF